MPTVDFVVESPISHSMRVRQLSAMFDAPAEKKCRIEYRLELPIDANDWNVGLIVGPSGSGKSTVMNHVFGEPSLLQWGGASVVDDFDKSLSMEQISEVCQAVGFNTIPAWMRPHAVLSNGEKFRVDIARRLLELSDPIVVDEFTSVVDRQVAQIGSHAVQRYVRKHERRFVAVTCHYDVIDWLQPDWVLDMATRAWTRRLLQRRPPVECVVGRLSRAAWSLFAPFHYMSASLHRSARCFGLWANGTLAVMAAVIPFPHPLVRDIVRISRIVTLPDWQGLGLAFVLLEVLGLAYKATKLRLRNYPAHPAFVRGHDKSAKWRMCKAPGFVSPSSSKSTIGRMSNGTLNGSRPSASFEYIGQIMDYSEAISLLADGRG